MNHYSQKNQQNNLRFTYELEKITLLKNKYKFIANQPKALLIACTIQGIVANREALTWGKFRDGQVFIGGTDYTPPSADELDKIFIQGMQEINNIANAALKAWLIFLWGSLNQFFYDGNKRTSRLLANGVLLSQGLPMLNILAKDQLIYNQIMTDFYNTQDATQAIAWLYEYYYNSIHGYFE